MLRTIRWVAMSEATILALVCAGAMGQEWELRAPLPGPRVEQACAAWDGLIYAIGDRNWSANHNDAFLYNPQGDTWTQLPDMPTGRGMAAAAAIDGMVYVVGGNNCFSNCWLRTFEAFDTMTGTWVTGLPNLPGAWPRGLLSACTVNGKLYVMGGVNSYYGVSSENFVYDPATELWSGAAPLPRVRGEHGAVALNGKVYLIGGMGGGGSSNLLSETDVYDSTTDTWSSAAPIPTPRLLPACAVSNGKIYVMGGGEDGANAPPLSIADVYDPETDLWTAGVPLPSPRRQHCAVGVDDVLFVIGGNDGAGDVATVFATLPPVTDDCNRNGTPDDEDIADGVSKDCNNNGTPDECELISDECPYQLGDVNNDGQVNQHDVVQFTLVLLGLDHCVCSVEAADINGDGVVNHGDVRPFMRLVRCNLGHRDPLREPKDPFVALMSLADELGVNLDLRTMLGDQIGQNTPANPQVGIEH